MLVACFSPLEASSMAKFLILEGFVPSIQKMISFVILVERPSHILVILVSTAYNTSCFSSF